MRRLALALTCFVTLSCVRAGTVASTSVGYQTPAQLAAARVYPGTQWDSITDPRTAGWRREGLDSVRAKLSTMASTGFVAVVGGRKLMTYGNIDTVTYLASVRKSILSMM